MQLHMDEIIGILKQTLRDYDFINEKGPESDVLYGFLSNDVDKYEWRTMAEIYEISGVVRDNFCPASESRLIRGITGIYGYKIDRKMVGTINLYRFTEAE